MQVFFLLRRQRLIPFQRRELHHCCGQASSWASEQGRCPDFMTD